MAEIVKQTIKYTQDADCNSSGEQFIEISTEDGGAGVYFVIKTERWAFDNIEELKELINKFKK